MRAALSATMACPVTTHSAAAIVVALRPTRSPMEISAPRAMVVSMSLWVRPKKLLAGQLLRSTLAPKSIVLPPYRLTTGNP